MQSRMSGVQRTNRAVRAAPSTSCSTAPRRTRRRRSKVAVRPPPASSWTSRKRWCAELTTKSCVEAGGDLAVEGLQELLELDHRILLAERRAESPPTSSVPDTVE